jgi:hypothetical protein
LARLIAVQALYQYDFYERSISIVKIAKEMIENYLLNDEKN